MYKKSFPLKPLKKFSQNFLTDPTVAKRIVTAIDIQPTDHVIEIGPGKGALTSHILAYNVPTTIIDIDQRAILILQEMYPQERYPHLRIIQADATKISFDQLHLAMKETYPQLSERVKIIGNLPYSITSDLLFHIYSYGHCVERCICMIQKEVAQRVVAKTRTKEYGILTLATAVVGSARILFDVKPGSFFPVPKVTSSVFQVIMHEQQMPQPQRIWLTTVVRTAFNQRRKMLQNALKPLNVQWEELPAKTQAYSAARAEELTLDNFIDLSLQTFEQRSKRVM